MKINDTYFASRLKDSKKRRNFWEKLCKYYFNQLVGSHSVVLDLGAGRCEFINNIDCREKYAVDQWKSFPAHANLNVNCQVTSVTNLGHLKSDSVDVVFASNLVEHLTVVNFEQMLIEVKRILTEKGKLILLQPNFRYSSKKYFDDYTHISVWSHVSLPDYLFSQNFKIKIVIKKFLPFSINSRLPAVPILIWIYLKLPLKFLAGQMLVIAEKSLTNEES